MFFPFSCTHECVADVSPASMSPEAGSPRPDWLPVEVRPELLVPVRSDLKSPRQWAGRPVALATLLPLPAGNASVIQAAMPPGGGQASAQEVLSFLGMLITHDVRELLVVRGEEGTFLDGLPRDPRAFPTLWSADSADDGYARASVNMTASSDKWAERLLMDWQASGPQLVRHGLKVRQIDASATPTQALLRIEEFCNRRDALASSNGGHAHPRVAVAGARDTGALSAVILLVNEVLARRELIKTGASPAAVRAAGRSPAERLQSMTLDLFLHGSPLASDRKSWIDDGLRKIEEVFAPRSPRPASHEPPVASRAGAVRRRVNPERAR